MAWTRLHGKLAQGYRVASGPSADYPYGALDRQRPLFAARGLDLSEYFNGTLNVDISSRTFAMQKPEYTFERVEWTDLHPPETFSFSRCKVVYRDVEYDGWVYYPHPETKLRNFQNPSLLEVIAKSIPNIQYGDELDVLVNDEEIAIQPQPIDGGLPQKEESQPRLSRNQLIIGISAAVVLLLLIGIGLFLLFDRKPEAGSKLPVLELGYCDAGDIRPCIVSFSLDADNQMLVNLLTPTASYPDFYLIISTDSEENRYECTRMVGFPTHVYCTGKQMSPGLMLNFSLFAVKDDHLLAQGTFSIIGLMLITPVVETTATIPGTEITTPTSLLLQTPTPTPGLIVLPTLTPTYPNLTSYPNPTAYP